MQLSQEAKLGRSDDISVYAKSGALLRSRVYLAWALFKLSYDGRDVVGGYALRRIAKSQVVT